MENLATILQHKADKAYEIYMDMCASNKHDLEPVNLSVSLTASPSKVETDGSFIVLTGNRVKPYGIGSKNPPELVFLYNDKGGLFLETSLVRKIILDNKDVLEKCIDETYSIMGVKLNLGIVSNYVNESFLDSLTALHEDGY